MEKEVKKVRIFIYKNDEKNGRSPIKRQKKKEKKNGNRIGMSDEKKYILLILVELYCIVFNGYIEYGEP